MVRPNLVLTPRGGLADNILTEVSVANSKRRYPAHLKTIDHSSNLALVQIEAPELEGTLAPLPLGDPITIDDEFDIWLLGDRNLMEKSTARVQRVAPISTQLQLTVKTSITGRGNGQVALKDGKIVGLVVGANSGRQEATLMSIETIRHFLDDFDDGDYKGFGTGGVYRMSLLRDDLRAYYEVPEDVHGVVVTDLVEGRTGYGVLQVGDVITEVDGHALDDEGMYQDPKHGRLHSSYLLFGKTSPGDVIPMKIVRKGEAIDEAVPVAAYPLEKQLVPTAFYDRRPSYMVVGGLVLLELSRMSRVTPRLQRRQARAGWEPQDDRKRIIFASRVLDDQANKGLDDIGGYAVVTVNGKKITEMADIAEALKTPLGGFHVITFDGVEKDFVIRADQLEETDKRIAERYRISELSYLGD